MSKRKLGIFAIGFLICLGPLRLAQGQDGGSSEDAQGGSEPAEIGIAEQTERRLAQLDISVSGPEEAIRNLTADDFDLRVGGQRIEGFHLDRICEAPGEGGETESPVTVPTTYIFYFEQTLLSVAGRNRAIRLAREMIPELVTGYNQASVVSNGRELTTFASLTQDVEVLTGAVDRIMSEPGHWDPSLVPNQRSIANSKMYMGGRQGSSTPPSRGVSMNVWPLEKSLSRLSLTIGQLTHIDPPKVLIYFANSLGPEFSLDDPNAMRLKAWIDSRIERAIDRVNEHGVRVHTFRDMRGIVATRPGSPGITNPALTILSRASGGQALGDPTAETLASRIRSDLGCFYLISFDAAGFEEDVAHDVDLKMRRRRVKARSRSSLTVQSESSRRTDRLLAAFGSPEAVGSTVDLHGLLIPTGFHEGRYRALVQAAVDRSTTSGSVWDIGSSLVSEGKVREAVSGRLTVSRADVPVVFESEMSFRPGEFELTLVAQETHQTMKAFNQVGSRRIEGAWPRPDKGDPFVGPIAVVQTANAVFLRDGSARARGSLALNDDQPVRTDSPTSLVSIVCRGSSQGTLQIGRRLIGTGVSEFGPVELDGKDPCASVRDLIPAGTLGEGSYRYEIRLVKGEREVAVAERSFVALQPDRAAEPSGSR